MTQQFHLWNWKYTSIQKLVYKCSLIEKSGNTPNVWINKKWHIYTMDHNLVIKTNEDTAYNRDEPWKDYAKWKKINTKEHILYDHIYMKYPE